MPKETGQSEGEGVIKLLTVLMLLSVSAVAKENSQVIYLPGEQVVPTPTPWPNALGVVLSGPPKPLDIEWVGHPMISDSDPFTPSEGWLPGVEIGLRSDGVVVWRNVRKK